MSRIKELLVDQFLANANDPSWYLPFADAVIDVSEKEAFWKPTEGSHCIAEIVQHLIYWNKTWQTRYQNSDVKAVPSIDNNDKSFVVPENKTFQELKERLLSVLLQWEKILTDDQLERNADGFPVPAKWYDLLGNAITHNAYHIGQIVYIQKLQKG